MSDFWARKLAAAQGQQPPAVPQGGLTPTGAPWWATPAYGAPQQPVQAPQVPQTPQQEYATVKAASARQDSNCPNCGGSNYFKPSVSTQARCFECGHQARGAQSMSGVAVVSNGQGGSTPVRASLHEAQGAGYRPDMIVGRL